MHASAVLFTLSIASVFASPLFVRSNEPWPNATTTVITPSLAGNPSATPNPAANPELVSQLIDEALQVDRFTTLKGEVDKGKASFKFDFNPAANPAAVIGEGGAAIVAQRKAFPPVTGLGLSAAALFFAPCGLNTPHIHPRASEFLTVVSDSNILSGFVLENGFSTEVSEKLTQYQGMVLPQGSIHWQQNLDCVPAVAMSALNSDDPGASSIANRFFDTNQDVALASLGLPSQITADNYAAFKGSIPTPFVKGIQECYQRCGIPH